MQEFHVEAGYTIIEQGDSGDAFFVIKEGTAKVTVSKVPASSFWW